MIALTTYFIHVYVLLPIVWKGVQWVYDKRYDFYPVVKCIRPLSACLTDSECRLWLDAVAECQVEGSEARKRAEEAFGFVQHPQNPAYCQYQTFDQITNSVAIDFLECIGKSGCLPPSQFSDTCADMTNIPKLPMNQIISNLKGRWNKVYTTGWDTWPCQWTDFWAPHSEEPEPEDWMTKWPSTPNVWRMDLYWKPEASANMTFHMNNEMYLDQTWNFTINKKKAPPSTSATLKTRAVMWGTEAHENWYLLDYHPKWNTMLVYYCAYTAAVDAYDSMAMVLKRQDDDGDDPLSYSVDLTSEQQGYYKSKAMELLGEFHGNLQQIRACQ